METRCSRGAVLALAVASGCALSGDPEVESRASAAQVAWNPPPIDPALCNDPEVTPSRPPDPSGHCDIEVRATAMKLVNGQGVSEGRAEVSARFIADPLDLVGPNTTAWASTATYTKGQTNGMSLDLGTYRVEVGDTKHVEVCATFTEHDNGGSNGGDDVASGCTTLTLVCDAQSGQPSYDQNIGPSNFCGKNVCNGSMKAEISVMAADADMDEVPNDEDFTPELCDDERKGTAGVGLLLYFHYDDSSLVTLAQSLWTTLAGVYPSYDHVVLVADNDTSNPANTSGEAWSQADRVFPPTQAGLLDAMQELTSRGYRFDTFVHAHGYKAGADDSTFETLEGEQIGGEWLVGATAPELIGTARGGVPIVAWWSTTCLAARQIDAWMEIGALTASGAVDVQFYPNTWGNFVDAWIAGDTYRTAVDASLTGIVLVDAEALIYAQGLLPPWLCGGSSSVLEESACAFDFFNDVDDGGPDEAQYDISEVYRADEPGASNMFFSSIRIFLGDTQIGFGGGGHGWP